MGITALTMIASAAQAAPITFTHFCTSPAACDFDAAFAFTITLDSSVVSANGSYDTTPDGGAAFLGWTGASDVGDGFSIAGGFADIDGGNDGIEFGFDANSLIVSILRVGANSILGFFRPKGRIFFQETETFAARQDLLPVTGGPHESQVSSHCRVSFSCRRCHCIGRSREAHRWR